MFLLSIFKYVITNIITELQATASKIYTEFIINNLYEKR